jgi:hypothetical protein
MSDLLTFAGVFGAVFMAFVIAAAVRDVSVWSLLAAFWREYVRTFDITMRRVNRALGIDLPDRSPTQAEREAHIRRLERELGIGDAPRS